MREDWKDIPGFNGRYQINSEGIVKVMYFYKRSIKKVRLEPLILKIQYNSVTKYLQYELRNDLRKRRTYAVHRLIVEAFLGPIIPPLEVCHNNGVRTDNRLENLRIDTRKNNMIDRVKHLKGKL